MDWCDAARALAPLEVFETCVGASIVGIYPADDESCLVRICVSDVRLLNKLRDDGLTGRLEAAIGAELQSRPRKPSCATDQAVMAPAEAV